MFHLFGIEIPYLEASLIRISKVDSIGRQGKPMSETRLRPESLAETLNILDWLILEDFDVNLFVIDKIPHYDGIRFLGEMLDPDSRPGS
ncbi:uncharacterized protein N7529_003065 [Penicillium soppii]|uniref:uncharacterized protein n=1 Tax=Penicillium soppii TaxID=69789 RepID=UPI00254803B2|nr:uncharacterized protein N7529_003065 [Penicillium soppii]KAJ5874635.1 hypothetical protein N7529_003065 [Penicillium soppii]